MKLASFDGGRVGAIVGERIVDLTDLTGAPAGAWPPASMLRLIVDFGMLTGAIEERIASGKGQPLAAVRLETPVPWPNKVIAFPANYHAHIAEMGEGNVISTFTAKGQGFFLKANSSLSGPADPIRVPAINGRETHHECELAIIIGEGGRGIAAADAARHIFGYACLVDVVVRGKEERVMRKSFDSFCPVGPWITTADEIPDFNDIDLRLSVNGALRQQANTRDLIVDVPEMIAMASSVMTLFPGDIIATGTPAGVGPIAPGDTLEIEIDRVGAMRLAVEADTEGAHSVWDKAG
jgi:2-keto-4-pentenoate hydratase/2-oxohepta-3-ene-1,7-dioic acid hydratase in catechol pathway